MEDHGVSPGGLRGAGTINCRFTKRLERRKRRDLQEVVGGDNPVAILVVAPAAKDRSCSINLQGLELL